MPLVIDIMRHGEAVPSDPKGDGERALAPAGVERIGALAARLAASGWAPERIFTSPYRRATQTAELMRSALSGPAELETLAELHPDADPEELVSALRAIGADGHLLLVSHMPLVSRLCGYLCGRTVAFRTGDIARLECADGIGRGAAQLVRISAV